MGLTIDVVWSFRSRYSYLATPRLVRLAAEYDVDIGIRVVLPIAVRILGFFDTGYPLWPPYLLRDTMRIAEYEGIPYGWPRPDPIVRDFVTRKVARGRARLAPRDRRRILSRRRRRRPMTLTVARRGDGVCKVARRIAVLVVGRA